jgi:hypothetical protein
MMRGHVFTENFRVASPGEAAAASAAALGDPEITPTPLPPDAGHVTPINKAAGPVIDRVWRTPPKYGGGPVPTRAVPASYRQWPRRPLGATLGAVSGWLPLAALSALWVGAIVYGARRASLRSPVRRLAAARRRKGDKMRDQDVPTAVGYELDRESLTPARRTIDTSAPGDYGADPIGDGLFRMVPSGDIVDFEERNRRLKSKLRGPERDIVYESAHHYAVRTAKGFEVYKMGPVAATRVATIGYRGDQGLQRVKAEIARREEK